MTLISDSNKGSSDRNSDQEPTRAEEQGEASEPDAPTGVDENQGMSTVLGPGAGTGVQPDADAE
jgi:hypothetical protein